MLTDQVVQRWQRRSGQHRCNSIMYKCKTTMKTFKNNFTTQEQSKRLLELGVPAWTADCFYPIKTSDMPIIIADIKVGFNLKYSTPCWSVGRLIEIHRIYSTLPDEEYMFPFWKDQEDNIEWSIRVLESGIMAGNIDFQNLGTDDHRRHQGL